jgi:hypothetical protein
MPILIAVVAVAGAIGTALAAVFGPLYLGLFRRELARADEMEHVARTLGLPSRASTPPIRARPRFVFRSSSSRAGSNTPRELHERTMR